MRLLKVRDQRDIRKAIQTKLSNASMMDKVIDALNWLKMLDKDNMVEIPLGGESTIIDAFCAILQKKLVYEKGERDMVAMHHEFGIERSNGKKVCFFLYFVIITFGNRKSIHRL